MPDTLRAKNWSKFQHYKHRNPPWIRLHRSILDDYDFQCLPLASKALAPMLWLVASEVVDGVISMPPRNLAFKLRVTEAELSTWVKPLIEKGFFEAEGSYASGVLAPCLQVAAPEYRDRVQSTEKVKTIAQQTPLSESRFDVFWESYPRKVGKPAARKAWGKILGIENHSGEVLAGLSRWIVYWTDPEYIPHPATFLNQRRWEDDVPARKLTLEEHNAEVVSRVAARYATGVGSTPRQKN